MKFLPETYGKRWGYVNLENYCVRNAWNAKTGAMPVSDIHNERNIECSYGGYLEYRKEMLNGTYLDFGMKYLHLGVDFNVPIGTSVASVASCEIMAVDNDHPEPHGWGPRVILKQAAPGYLPIYLIYSHLDDESIAHLRTHIGSIMSPGYSFAKVGQPPFNGGWWTHVHIQAMTHETWVKYENNLSALDGYGRLEDINELARDFPDPLPILIGD